MLRQYLVDACIAVKLVLNSESDHAKVAIFFGFASSIEMTSHSVTEAFGVLKRKWLSKNPNDHIDDGQYHHAAYVLNAILKERVQIVGEPLVDSETLFLAAKKSEEYGIDVLDCLQLLAAKQMQQRGFVGTSAPAFVTADQKLMDAAIKEGINCIGIEAAFQFESKDAVERLRPLS